MPSGPSHDPDRRHLHVVCNDTDADGNNLLVPIATWKNPLCDGTCILLPHEHPWLKKPKSYVMYRNAGVYEAQALQRGVVSSKIVVEDDCNGQVFLKIRNGICASPHTPRKIKGYYGC